MGTKVCECWLQKKKLLLRTIKEVKSHKGKPREKVCSKSGCGGGMGKGDEGRPESPEDSYKT